MSNIARLSQPIVTRVPLEDPTSDLPAALFAVESSQSCMPIAPRPRQSRSLRWCWERYAHTIREKNWLERIWYSRVHHWGIPIVFNDVFKTLPCNASAPLHFTDRSVFWNPPTYEIIKDTPEVPHVSRGYEVDEAKARVHPVVEV